MRVDAGGAERDAQLTGQRLEVGRCVHEHIVAAPAHLERECKHRLHVAARSHGGDESAHQRLSGYQKLDASSRDLSPFSPPARIFAMSLIMAHGEGVSGLPAEVTTRAS